MNLTSSAGGFGLPKTYTAKSNLQINTLQTATATIDRPASSNSINCLINKYHKNAPFAESKLSSSIENGINKDDSPDKQSKASYVSIELAIEQNNQPPTSIRTKH